MSSEEKIDPVQIPIAIISFNRPAYLTKFLQSLRNQSGVDWATRRIALFQDNAINAYSGRKHAEQDDIDASITAFREVFREGEVHLADANLGVCENYQRAETWVFEDLKTEFGYFFEDDMILSQNYILMLNQLAEIATTEKRIGYFSAYGKYKLPMKDQLASQGKLIRLEQHWGFGLKRSHWMNLQTWLKPYFEMVVGHDYRERSTDNILEHYRSLGAPVCASSQDDVKKTCTYMLGSCGLNTVAVFGKYIGESGLNMNIVKFNKLGYSKTELFEGGIPKIRPCSPTQVDKLIEAELATRRVRVERSKVAAALKPPVPSAAAFAQSRSTGAAHRSVADDPPEKQVPPKMPAGVVGLRPLIEAADGRLKLGAKQRGFAAMTAQDFMAGGHHLFEFAPISELFVQYQLSTLSDDHTVALLKQAYLAAGDDARMTLHEFDEAEATAPQKWLKEQGGFHARSAEALAELLASAGFSDFTPHRYRLASGALREAFTPDVAVLVDTKLRGSVTGVIVSAVKRRASAPDFFNHSYTIRTRRCVDEHFQQIPWLTYPAIEYLKQLDFSGKRIFEYGCGNSTAFWSRLCKEVVSVDHDAKWVDTVRGWELPRSTLLHEDVRKLYARSIENFGKFDLIVIDGRFRNLCADLAPDYLNEGGMLILDNSERYPELTKKFRNLDFIQIDFVGYVPLNRTLSVTSFFLRRDFSYAPRKSDAPTYRWGLHDSPERRVLDRASEDDPQAEGS